MFVRFRKVPNGGFRPYAAANGAARIACRYPGRWGACRGNCPAKPRCRWVIGKHFQLSPYRLKIMVVENRRINGKVKQETIAVLGSIDATWLPEFWEDTPGDLKCEDWELYSLRARTAFWKNANHRLQQIANRLGPDTKRIRMAVHKRVPWPMEPERKRLELLEAKHEYDWARRNIEMSKEMIVSYEEGIKAAQELLERCKKLAHDEVLTSAAAAHKLVKLTSR